MGSDGKYVLPLSGAVHQPVSGQVRGRFIGNEATLPCVVALKPMRACPSRRAANTDPRSRKTKKDDKDKDRIQKKKMRNRADQN